MRSRSDFSLPIAKTVFGGLDTLSYLGSEIWEIVALEIKVVALYYKWRKKSDFGIQPTGLAGFAKDIFIIYDLCKDLLGAKVQIC